MLDLKTQPIRQNLSLGKLPNDLQIDLIRFGRLDVDILEMLSQVNVLKGKEETFLDRINGRI